MDIDFDGRVGLLTDFMPGTFFVTRDEQRTIFGISAMHSDDPMAILFNLAINPSDPFPEAVTTARPARGPITARPISPHS